VVVVVVVAVLVVVVVIAVLVVVVVVVEMVVVVVVTVYLDPGIIIIICLLLPINPCSHAIAHSPLCDCNIYKHLILLNQLYTIFQNIYQIISVARYHLVHHLSILYKLLPPSYSNISYLQIPSQFLGAFEKLRRATIGFVTSVRLSVCLTT